jgi:hypothetical protein
MVDFFTLGTGFLRFLLRPFVMVEAEREKQEVEGRKVGGKRAGSTQTKRASEKQ